MSDHVLADSRALVLQLKSLRSARRERKHGSTAHRRRVLSPTERRIVLERTSGRCHICGGQVAGTWQADHVLAHSAGGASQADNYLPAHSLCNNYRWDYLPEEFQLILRLGVWLRTQIEKETPVGNLAAEQFVRYEQRRVGRRRRAV